MEGKRSGTRTVKDRRAFHSHVYFRATTIQKPIVIFPVKLNCCAGGIPPEADQSEEQEELHAAQKVHLCYLLEACSPISKAAFEFLWATVQAHNATHISRTRPGTHKNVNTPEFMQVLMRLKKTSVFVSATRYEEARRNGTHEHCPQ